MSNSEKSSNNSEREPGLTKETVDEIKYFILGIGDKPPPRQTQFKKGQSGNPKGRPKRLPPLSNHTPSMNDLVLKEAKRLVTVREGDEVREIPKAEAVLRAQHFAATVKMNAYAQKDILNRYERAERERRREIDRQIEAWEQYILLQWETIANAVAKGEVLPTPLPHPDDIVLDRENGVRFIGPVTEWEMERLQDTLRLRDILIMQDALDQRFAPRADSDDPLDQPGSAMCLAFYFNETVPERFKLRQTEVEDRSYRFLCTPKRTLLKDLYRSWRAYGWPLRRGFTFPPLRAAKTMLETSPELVGLMKKFIDGEIEADIFRERVVEFLSRTSGLNAHAESTQ